MGACDVRVTHRGRRPHLTGVVEGVHFFLAIPVRPKDLKQNYFNAIRDLRKTIASVRKRTNSAA
jgi:hypothetical protein